MTIPDPPTPRSPFSAPSPRPAVPFDPAQVPRDGPGCSKPLLIGCGGALLVVVLVVVVFLFQQTAIMKWWFHTFEATLAPRLPADLTAAERENLHLAFEAAANGVGKQQSDVDLKQLKSFQSKMMLLSNPKAPVTRQDVRDLTVALNALTGRRAPPPAAPLPAPSSTSPPSPTPPPAASTSPPASASAPTPVPPPPAPEPLASPRA